MKNNTRHWAGITAGILSLACHTSAASLGSEKYTYDASGNIIEKSIDGVVTKMSFDRSNRLIERQTAGQDKETTAYDAAGRPVTERNADGQPTRSLSYGYGDKVLETQTQDSKAGFYYNAEGQMVGKNVEGTVSTYTWDNNVLAAEGDEAFANEAHISGGVPVLASGKDIVISDYLGNTLASGHTQLTGTAYGEGLEDGRFTGKLFVEELGSFVFKQRNYSVVDSRWITADPTGYPDGNNNYMYVHGDPMARFDAYGLEQVTLTCHWVEVVGEDEFGGDATTLFNYTFEADSNGKLKLKTHAFAGIPEYTGTQGYVEYFTSADVDVDTDADSVPDAKSSMKCQYGTYGAERSDTSGEWVESKKDDDGITRWRDRASAKLWINEPLATSNGYFSGPAFLSFVVTSGPTSSTSHIDEYSIEFFGDWIER